MGLVVEFQRRAGDALAFAQVFRDASQHLRISSTSVDVCHHADATMDVPTSSFAVTGQEDQLPTETHIPACEILRCIQPVLDVTTTASSLGEEDQVGALCALVALRKMPASFVRSEMGESCVRLESVLARLEKSPSPCVAYLAALCNTWLTTC